jgi:hypothetical protein
MALLKKKNEDSGNGTSHVQGGDQTHEQTHDRNAINPAIDQKITDYMNANPKQVDYLNGLSKERLVRKFIYEVDIKSMEAKQNLARGFRELALSNPALVEAVKEIRATQPPERQEQEIARLGKAFAISTNTRVAPIRAPKVEDGPTQAGPKVSV